MDFRLKEVNKLVKSYDKKLYAERNKFNNRKIHIYRKDYCLEKFEHNGIVYGYFRDCPYHVISLTDNWTEASNPREWGLELIYARLQQIDSWNRTEFMKELEEKQIKAAKSRERDRKNNTEAFLYDFAGQFRKTFNDINTANMKK